LSREVPFPLACSMPPFSFPLPFLYQGRWCNHVSGDKLAQSPLEAGCLAKSRQDPGVGLPNERAQTRLQASRRGDPPLCVRMGPRPRSSKPCCCAKYLPPPRFPRMQTTNPASTHCAHPQITHTPFRVKVASGPGLAGELHRVFASRPSPGGPQWAVIEPSMSAGIRDWTAVAHMKRHYRRCAWTAHADCQHPAGLEFRSFHAPLD